MRALDENKQLIILVTAILICIALIIHFTYSTGWNNGYSEKVIGVRTPMIQSVGHNCKIVYVRKKVLSYSSIIRGIFICADENEPIRSHLRVLFARVRSLDELYFFKGAGYVYDCATGGIKVIWPHPMDEELFFEFNTSQAKKFCEIDLSYDLSKVVIEGCEDCHENLTFYGFEDLEKDLNVTDA